MTTPDNKATRTIRGDAARQRHELQHAILAGYGDLAAGRTFASAGDLAADMKLLDRVEADEWR